MFWQIQQSQFLLTILIVLSGIKLTQLPFLFFPFCTCFLTSVYRAVKANFGSTIYVFTYGLKNASVSMYKKILLEIGIYSILMPSLGCLEGDTVNGLICTNGIWTSTSIVVKICL